jgi:hypothetical protein
MRVQFDYLDNGTVLGHKARCLILQQALVERGHTIVTEKPNWLVCDYPNAESVINKPIPAGAQRLVMGLEPQAPEDWSWHALHAPMPRMLTGEQYLILNPYIRTLNAEYSTSTPVQYELLITMGGADPFYLTEKALAYLENHTYKHITTSPVITIVIGPNFKRDIVVPARYRVLTAPSPTELLTEMHAHSAVLCGWGNSSFEALALGRKTVSVVQSNEHANEAALLDASYVTRNNFTNAFTLLPKAKDVNIDGCGAQRVVDFMESHCQY